MNLTEIISDITGQNEEAIIFAKKIDGAFLPTSEVRLIEVDDDEIGLPTNEIANKYCPGFDYFLEVSVAQEVLEDLNSTTDNPTLDQQVDRVIHYAEFDA